MKRLLVAGVLSAIACTVAFAKTGTFSALASTAPSIETASRLYTNDTEAVVSEIAGSILNIAASASHFAPGDPFHVRNVGSDDRPRFRLTRRGEVFTVRPAQNVWEPANYVALARSFMADGADAIVSEDLATEGSLQDHPRSAALHRKAAAELAAQLPGGSSAETRALRCQITAHLAVAIALHADKR
jgi:hypothetical protein